MSTAVKLPTVAKELSGLDHVPVASLEPFQGELKDLSKREYNKLKKAMLEEGIFVPFFVWRDGNNRVRILDGHQRDRVMIKEAWGFDVPVLWIAARDEAHAKKRLLLISSQYGKVTQEGWDGFTFDLDDDWLTDTVQFDALPFVFDLPPQEPEEASDAEPQTSRADELREEWGVELGQMWRLPSRTPGQEHRLICGDCTDADVVERVLNGESPVVLFTDPPYGVSIGKKNVMLNSFQKAGRNLTDIVSDDLSPIELKAMLLPAFTIAKKKIADDCSVFVTAPQGGELGSMMMMMMMEAGLPVRHVLNWVKNSQTFSMGRLDYDYKHEPILFTWGKKHRKNKGLGFNNSCWEIDKPRSSAEHPTMKPVELYQQAYANHCDNGDVVYEMFCGSGTAIIAAENLARQCRAVEISPGYVAVALQRYADAFNITPELITQETAVPQRDGE